VFSTKSYSARFTPCHYLCNREVQADNGLRQQVSMALGIEVPVQVPLALLITAHQGSSLDRGDIRLRLIELGQLLALS